MKQWLATLATAVALCGVAPPAPAFDWPPPCWQARQFTFDNDVLGASSHNSDWWYTTGLLYSWAYKDECVQASDGLRWWRDTAKRVLRPSIDPRTDKEREPVVFMALGHNTYTPRETDRVVPLKTDRPYAGFLFGSIGAVSYHWPFYEALELKLGVIGPASGAEQLQEFVHDRITHENGSKGWDSQVRARLGVQASYAVTHRLVSNSGLPPDWLGIHSHLRWIVGTVRTQAALGYSFVAGERSLIVGTPDEGDHFGLDVDGTRHNAFHKAPWPFNRTTWFVQQHIAYVAYNHLITGPTYANRPEIDLKHKVLMSSVGFSYRHSAEKRFLYRINWKSRDFESRTPSSNDRTLRYGEIRFSWDMQP